MKDDFDSCKARTFALHAIAGGVAGILVLHPVSMLVRWLEVGAEESASLFRLSTLGDSLINAFVPAMITMVLIDAAVGAAVGLGFGYYHIVLMKGRGVAAGLEGR